MYKSRRHTSEILYPFGPAALAARSHLHGMLDALFFIDPDDSEAIPAGLEFIATYRSHCTVLYSVEPSPTGTLYTFYSITGGRAYKRTFQVQGTLVEGIAKIPAAEDLMSFVAVNARYLSRTAAAMTSLYPDTAIELEPSRTIWTMDRVTELVLHNEYRHHDPSQRESASGGQKWADLPVASFSGSDIVRLASGYNCELAYDENTGTLTVTGGAGLGDGVPAAIPWDDTAENFFAGVMSLNGINKDGATTLQPGKSLRFSYLPPNRIGITATL